MNKNPFIYGEIVKGENFINRKDEIKELMRDLKDSERIFLISPRRYGKTSLIINVLEKLKKEGYYSVYIDLYKATSLNKLLEIYAYEIANAVETKLERIVKFIKDILPTFTPKVIISKEGLPSLQIEYTPTQKETLKYLDEIYNIPEKIAIKKKKKFVIAFDEFQEIRNFNGETIEKQMRAIIQHHKNVGYLFAGSKRHMMYDMFFNKSKAFYKMGRIMELKKLPHDEFKEFIENAFIKTGFKIEDRVADEILNLTEDYPYNAQFLAHKLWDMYFSVKRIKIEDVKVALNQILSEQSPFYISLWDTLSLNQRQLLKAIATYGGNNIFSQEFIKINNLGALSSIQTSVKLLIKKQILDKINNSYIITDVFFKEWIRNKI